MLTGDLLRVRVKGKELHCAFIDPNNPRLLDRARELVDLFTRAVAQQWTSGAMEDALRELVGVDTDHKLTRGLAKVLLDRCDQGMLAELDPVDLRRRVFTAAAQGPIVAQQAGPTGRRVATDVFAQVGADLGVSAQLVAACLYADLKDQQRFISWKALDPTALLHRYNLALAQAVLLRASWLKLRLVAPAPKRLAQLLRYARFHQLMYRVESVAGGAAVLLHLDGPESLLRQSTRYGMQIATFLPAVLLQTGAWSLEAEIQWGRGRKLKKALNLDQDTGLVSHYRDTGTWKSQAEEFFEARWGDGHGGWTMRPGQVQVVQGQHVLVPAYTFEKDGRVAHLDIVGYWRKGYLQQRLERTPKNVVLAVSKRLCGDKAALPKALAEQILPFAEIIPVKKVVARLEVVAR
ncbi:MAG: DUF790 family protein [Oligoflexia bacterium]|nr:DUF790 family protein [Oligoflexia bacterium]